MSEWKEYKLGEICDVRDGTHDSPKANPSGYPLVTSKNIKDGKIDLFNTYFISEADYKFVNQRSKVEQWDIIYSMIGTIGECAIVKDVPTFAIKNVGLFKTNGNQLLAQWIYYYLHSSVAQKELTGRIKGSTQQYISLTDLREFPIMIPPIDEQKRIVGVLSSLDDKIDLLNRENATLEALAETLFRHYFIENPDSTWKEGKIADLVDFNPNRKLTKNEDSPYIEMANIETQGFAPSSWSMRPFASGTKFINGDAIMARISPCLENGKAAYIDFLEDGQVGWGSTEFLVMRSKMGLHPFFAYIMTRYDDFRDHAVSSLVGSSGRQRVDLDNLLKYSIFIPDEKAITRFNREMEMIVSKMRNNQLQMRTLAFQRDIILPRLMSGEVKVIGL